MTRNRHDRSRLRHQTLGVVFLLVVAAFFAGTIGMYNKAFTSVVPVTLEASKAGNQMRPGADVKVRGAVVGEVRSITQDNNKAVLHLALRPDSAKLIPASATARLRPKTLFGERYVDLQIPQRPGPTTLAAGDVIRQDHSASSIEVERVLDDLMPVLQAVQPQKLSATLSAVSHAIDGRGTQLGTTLVQLNDYLHRLNPSLPDMEAVLSRMDDVANTYADAAPDLLQAMSDFSVTSRTLVQQRDDLKQMLGTVTTGSRDLTAFLQANQRNMIKLSADSRPTLELLGRYAPEYPCMLKQFVAGLAPADAAFGAGTYPANRVTIEITGSRGKYSPGLDTPKYQDNRGPRCYPFVERPDTFPQYAPGGPLQDGSQHPPPPHDRNPAIPPNPGTTSPQSSTASGATPALVANSPAERQLIAALVAPSMGVPRSEVPGWSGLLVGPLFRGSEVTVR